MDILEDWALNIDEVGSSFIAGETGGLKFIDVDTWGGPLSRTDKPIPELEFHGYEEGTMITKKLNCSLNAPIEIRANPSIIPFNDNQAHWAAYLRGDLNDSTRIDTPYIALQTALLSEGIFISDMLRRSVTKEEIESMSKSTAIRFQKTDWGKIEYDF